MILLIINDNNNREVCHYYYYMAGENLCLYGGILKSEFYFPTVKFTDYHSF